jgi:PKD domain/PASTA domain
MTAQRSRLRGRSQTCGLILGLVVLALPGTSSAAVTWLPPQSLSSAGSGGVAAGPRVGFDAAGDALAVWQQQTLIQTAVRPAGGAWSTPEDISTGCPGATMPRLAVNPAGRAFAVWECTENTATVVQATVRASVNGAWATPQDVSSSSGTTRDPQVALDPDGDAVVVWSYVDDRQLSTVQASWRSAAGPWRPPDVLSAASLEVPYPQVAIDAAGNATTVWQEDAGTCCVVEASQHPLGGSWAAPTVLSDPNGYAERPQVATDAAGNAIAIWSGNLTTFRAQVAVHPAGSAWGQAETVSNEGVDAFEPQVAVTSGGAAVAAWVAVQGGRDIAQAISRSSDGTWSPAQDLTPVSDQINAPQLAIADDGDAVAVWTRVASSVRTIQAARRPAENSWTIATDISAPGSDPDLADVGLDPAGDGAAVWEREDGPAFFTAQAAGLDAAGPVLKSLTIKGRRTARTRLTFALSAQDVWSDLGAAHWRFGDGSRATGQRVKHTYSRPGYYTIRVSQTDVLGNESSLARRVRILAAPRCVVPAVIGKTLTKARAAIKKRHCRTGRVTATRSVSPPAGTVVAQHPRAGTHLPGGSRVSLVVSRRS